MPAGAILFSLCLAPLNLFLSFFFPRESRPLSLLFIRDTASRSLPPELPDPPIPNPFFFFLNLPRLSGISKMQFTGNIKSEWAEIRDNSSAPSFCQ